MADTSKDSALASRILTHMNNDHTTSLSLYLRHYLSLPASSTTSPRLTSITLTTLTIATPHGTHTIPLTPPLTTLADARQRLVDMDAASKAALGVHSALVRTWTPPRSTAHVAVAALVLFYACSYALRGYVVPGSAVFGALDRVWPGGAQGYLGVQELIVVPVVVVHVVETAVMAWRLRGAEVRVGRGVWWMWIASCLVEGFGAHQRFGALVRRARKEGKEGGH